MLWEFFLCTYTFPTYQNEILDYMILVVSMRAPHAVSWADQILHVHFKSTNQNH